VWDPTKVPGHNPEVANLSDQSAAAAQRLERARGCHLVGESNERKLDSEFGIPEGP
jgi:hypothetical protein